MTASSGGKPCPERTSTGRRPTQGCTVRHSRAGPNRSPGARTAYRMTTQPNVVRKTQTSLGQPGSRGMPHCRDHQECRTPGLLAAPLNSAGATMRGGADLRHAVMYIVARFVGGRIQHSPADRATSAHAHLLGHQRHRPEGRGLQRGTELLASGTLRMK